MGQQRVYYGNDVRFKRRLLKNAYILLPLCEIETIHENPPSIGNLYEGAMYYPLTCYFVNLPQMLNGGSIPLPFVRNPYFVNKVCLYTPSTRIMYENLSV